MTRDEKINALVRKMPPATTNEALKACPFCEAPAVHVRQGDGHNMYRFVRCTENPLHRAGNGCNHGAPGRNGNTGKCDHCFKHNLECLFAEQEWQLREATT